MRLRPIARTTVLLGAVLAAGAAGCKAKCIDPPQEGIDRDTMFKLQEAVKKGDTSVCKELGRPHVSLASASTDVVLRGMKEQKIATRDSLPPQEMKRIDPLFHKLKEFREVYKQLYFETPFPGDIDLLLDPALETPRALSVIQTAAFAGYGKSHMTIGTTKLDMTVAVPQPPDEEEKEKFYIFIEWTKDGTFTVRRGTSKCVQLGKTAGVHEPNLPDAIAALCSSPSSAAKGAFANAVEIIVPPQSRFGDVARITSSVLNAMVGEKPAVRLALTGMETVEQKPGAPSNAPGGFQLPCMRKTDAAITW